MNTRQIEGHHFLEWNGPTRLKLQKRNSVTKADQPKYSAIIPVYNSQDVVEQTIDAVVDFFEARALRYEVVLVNDGSRDGSWDVLRRKASANPNIVAIRLLKNYGQHNAVFCGLKECSGDYAITLDDDLQNPPAEMEHLIRKASEGYDLVFGRFREKKHSWVRKLGTHVVRELNRRVFNKPPDLVLTNFRIIRRDVIDRMIAYRTAYPYIPGLALMFSGASANVLVEHHERRTGKSNYGFFRILELVTRILFNYSSYPLRFVSGIGVLISVFSFVLAGYYFFHRLVAGGGVPGWTTVVVLLSIFNGLLMLTVSMLGEYTVRLLAQTSSGANYQVSAVIRGPTPAALAAPAEELSLGSRESRRLEPEGREVAFGVQV